MGVFHFRRFDVANSRSAMKVNTDGVLLGALMTVRQSDMLSLDAGTGTGTVALMAAQRLSDLRSGDSEAEYLDNSGVAIRALDIDVPSVEEAEANFMASPWSGILSALHSSLQEFRTHGELYDHIFSNPPYFEDSLHAPQERRNAARHSVSMSYRDLMDFASSHLSDDGILSLVLPSDAEKELLRYGRMSSLHCFRIVRIRTVERKSPSRIVAEFSRHRPLQCFEEMLTLQEKGGYTDDYREITKDFYLWK